MTASHPERGRSRILSLAQALEAGTVSAEALIDEALARWQDRRDADGPVFIRLDEDRVRAAARQADMLRRAGRAPSPLAGIPFSVKDLFDVTGEVTTAGSVILRERAPATADAPAVARLKATGLVPFGRTNMTEFAYSGLGLNAHHGTPASVWDRETRRAPGGSSSGAALSVAAGLVPLALGSDTGGSCRVPAAFNRIAGFKPSHGRLACEGMFPLAPSFDDPGPLAATVEDLILGFRLMAAGLEASLALPPAPAAGEITLATLPDAHLALQDLEPAVAAAFEAALAALSAAGVRLLEIPLPEADIRVCGALSAFEAWQVHKGLMARHADRYDPRVRRRLEGAARVQADQAEDLSQIRTEMVTAFRHLATAADVQAWLMPTTPILPPPLAMLEADMDVHDRMNLLSLRNTFMGNFLDGCAVSLPAPADAPVGLMLLAPHGCDHKLLSLALAVDAILA